jgi:hypothetical protein
MSSAVAQFRLCAVLRDFAIPLIVANSAQLDPANFVVYIAA